MESSSEILQHLDGSESTKKLLEENANVYDDDFPPNETSLYNSTNSKLSKEELDLWKQFVWKKPKEIFGENFVLYSDGIDPNDIIQGCLGNCYFLSALSALAEIFVNDEVNESGVYIVNFTLGGENYKVLVDDHFPYSEKKGRPAFSQSKGKELWVMLLEKAWAKVNGNYENSIKGFVSEAFRALTGAPVVFYKHLYIQDIWNEIYNADQRKYIICASSGEGQLNKKRYDEMGLISEHAYAVIKAITINVNGEEVKLLQLRNPWGHKEWLGKWSDTSELWTDELRQLCGCREKDDGVFFICVEDYLSYFRTTVICKLHEDFQSNAIRCSHNLGEFSLIKITIKSKGLIFFTVSQFNQRWVRRSQEYEPSFVRMLLSKIVTEHEKDQINFPLKFIEGKCWKDEDTTIEFECEAGEYLAYVEIHWFNDKQFNNFVFRTYSKSVPELVEVKNKEDEYPNFLKDTLKSCARDSSSKKTYKEKEEPDIFRCFSITDSKAEYGFLYYENNSKTTILKEIVKFGELENLEILENDSNDTVEVEVNPGYNKIVILDRKDRGCSFNCTYYTAIIRDKDEILKGIKSKGKKSQIEYEGRKYEIYYYVQKNGDGYIWYFENETQNSTFDATFYFKLENLAIEREENKDKDQLSDEFRVRLKPNDFKILKLNVIDMVKSWGYKYSYSFKLKEDIKNNEEQIRKIKNNGSKKSLEYKGMDKSKESFDFYIFFQAEKYYWLFENNTSRYFKGTFSFNLKNLSIEVDEEEKKETIVNKDEEESKTKKNSKKNEKEKKKKMKKNKDKMRKDEELDKEEIKARVELPNQEEIPQNESDDTKEEEWDLYMKPGDICIKTIIREDPKKESKYKSSYSYSFSLENSP